MDIVQTAAIAAVAVANVLSFLVIWRLKLIPDEPIVGKVLRCFS